VQQNIFAGKYEIIDSLGTSIGHVEMDGWENIKGFQDYKFYSPNTDFVVLVENNLDYIIFSRSKDDRDWKVLLYKFSDDTLHLYEPIVEGAPEMLFYGRKVYSFVKEK
jgi:hypothetical protein